MRRKETSGDTENTEKCLEQFNKMSCFHAIKYMRNVDNDGDGWLVVWLEFILHAPLHFNASFNLPKFQRKTALHLMLGYFVE